MESFRGVISRIASQTVVGEQLQLGDRVTVEHQPSTGLYTVTMDGELWTDQASDLVDGLIQGEIGEEGYCFVLCTREQKLVGILYTKNTTQGIEDPDPGAGAWEADEEGAGGGDG